MMMILRERADSHYLTVEARDERGRGNRNTVELVIRLTSETSFWALQGQHFYMVTKLMAGWQVLQLPGWKMWTTMPPGSGETSTSPSCQRTQTPLKARLLYKRKTGMKMVGEACWKLCWHSGVIRNGQRDGEIQDRWRRHWRKFQHWLSDWGGWLDDYDWH